jgi:dTDP-4-dehydrorhamnose 3,5-epimerase
MQFEETKLKDCFIIKDTLFNDPRGYFFESFNQQKFNELTGLNVQFVQDNQSKSSKGVLRGLHFQLGIHSQAKLVRVLEGKVLDVAVDIRPNSKTFGEHVAIELSAENETQLFVPRGFAHGFVVLSDKATFFYKCDNYYHKLSEGGIIYNDPELAINWQLPSEELLLSDKDLLLNNLIDITEKLIF